MNPIGWCDTTWNPVTGCTKCSPACDNCYAERMAHRLKGRFGYPADEPFRVTLHPDKLDEPLKWRKPRRVFVVSMGDLFHPDVPFWFIDDVFDAMLAAPQHVYLLLTKRPENFYRWCDSTSNSIERLQKTGAWAGVSVWDQPSADRNVRFLLQIPAATRWVSYEPALRRIEIPFLKMHLDEFGNWREGGEIHWIVVGQETGPGARPAKAEWFNKVIEDCKTANVPVWVKKAPEGVPDVKELPE
jgi:protein gp37